MNRPPDPPADRASASFDAAGTVSAPAGQPADRAPNSVVVEGSAHPEPVEPQATEDQPSWDSDEYSALVAAGLRAPNQREFTLNSAYAWSLFRPEPSMLPNFPRHRHNPVEQDEG